ncbi:MAG: undecaprenyl-phosphate glucose phosphotransferase [Ardenticatenia bacterium]|nr:undecaprenyl-phosphate glucose phosphotransferase [Ardenticatenia bacterium]
MKMRYPDPFQHLAENQRERPAKVHPIHPSPAVAEGIGHVRAEREWRRRRAFLFPLSLIAVDALMIVLAFYVAYWLRLTIEFPPPVAIPPFTEYTGMLSIHVAALLTTYFFHRLYKRKRALSHIDEFGRVVASTSIGVVLALAATSFIYKNSLDYPRLMIIYAWALTILFVAAGRIVHARLQWALQGRHFAPEHVLIVGAGETANIILRAIQRSPGLGYRAVGVVTVSGYPVLEDLSVPLLGTTDDLPRLIDVYGVDEVIIAVPEATHREIVHIIGKCEREKVSIKVFPDLFQFMAGEMSISDLNGLPLLTVRDIALRGWKLAVKRLVDIVVSATALVFLSPLMLVIAVLIKLESPGPVFYTQERMGLDAKPFQMLKFRSMRQDAEREGPGWTRPNDPRRTRVGAFIRRYSLDELPQLINVLLGEMSIVGPRPERPVYVEQFRRYIPRYMDRHREKAGITGWAQVNGLRGDTSIAERTKYDLWYVENWSLTLDFKIMLMTLVRIFTDRNAY